MSRVEAFEDPDPRSQLKEFRTDISMVIDDPFPLLYGLVDRSIISDQILKVSYGKYVTIMVYFILMWRNFEHFMMLAWTEGMYNYNIFSSIHRLVDCLS